GRFRWLFYRILSGRDQVLSLPSATHRCLLHSGAHRSTAYSAGVIQTGPDEEPEATAARPPQLGYPAPDKCWPWLPARSSCREVCRGFGQKLSTRPGIDEACRRFPLHRIRERHLAGLTAWLAESNSGCAAIRLGVGKRRRAPQEPDCC